MESQYTSEGIISFLRGSNWLQEKANNKFVAYRAPNSMIDDFVLTVPQQQEAKSSIHLDRIVRTICELYNLSDEMAETMFSDSGNGTLSIQIVDEITASGTIPFHIYESHIQELKKILLHNASFCIVNDALGVDVPEEAETYLNKCEFMQTQKGSFVSRIKLPVGRITAPLIGVEALDSSVINNKLADVLSFVFEKVTTGIVAFDRPAIDEYSSLINVKLLTDISSFLKKTNAESVNFYFKPEQDFTRTIQSGCVDEAAYDNLDRYIEFVGNSLSSPVEISSWGKVVELKSHNVKGQRKSIVVNRNGRGVLPIHINSLTNDQYEIALEAHRSNRYIRITGRAVQRKYYLRMVEIDTFSIREIRAS
ncbi:hypothetical protein [Hymenobacter terrenus]|uniref:hypothetical protein n=1 Tax=Hymenobacter terrenus TaxID=1629124 RepID=UPI000A7AB753|nr:hypothetical protein [Hymenobacter terrenus]